MPGHERGGLREREAQRDDAAPARGGWQAHARYMRARTELAEREKRVVAARIEHVQLDADAVACDRERRRQPRRVRRDVEAAEPRCDGWRQQLSELVRRLRGEVRAPAVDL